MVYSARSETRNVSANAASRRRFLKIGAAGILAGGLPLRVGSNNWSTQPTRASRL
jgi:hypothetical protein